MYINFKHTKTKQKEIDDMKYINKRGLTIEAIHFNSENLKEVMDFCGENLIYIPVKQAYFIVGTEGNWQLYNDDYVIKFQDRSYCPQMSDTFNKMYKQV